MNMTELRFGIIGWGCWGPKIVRNLDTLPHAAVTMIADLDAQRLASLAMNQSQSRLQSSPTHLLTAVDQGGIDHVHSR